MSNNRANVGSNEAQYIFKKNKNTFLKQFKDSIKTCYNEVNVVLADVEWVMNPDPWTPCMGAGAPEN